MYSQDENRPPPGLDSKGDDDLDNSRNRPLTLLGGAPATGCSSESGGNRTQLPALVMGASMGNSETPLSPVDSRVRAGSSPFSSSDAEDRFIHDQLARETIEVCSRFFKRQTSFAPRDRTGPRRRSKKRSTERMKTSPSLISSSCGDSMHSASSRSRTTTSSSQQSAGTALTTGVTTNLSIALTVPVAEEGMSKSQERLMKFSQQIEALKNQTQPFTRHAKQSSDTSAAVTGWYGTNRARDCTELNRGPRPIRAVSDPSVNRVSTAISNTIHSHTPSQDPSFSIPRVSTNESSSSAAANNSGSTATQQLQQKSKLSNGGGHGIGGSVHPPTHPTTIPAFTSNRPHELLGDSLSRPHNQTDENKFQKFVRKNLDKLMKTKAGGSSEKKQRRRPKSDPVSHRYSTTAVNSLPRNGHVLNVESQSNAANSQPNTAPGSTGTLFRRNSMSSRLLNRLNISQLFDNRVPGYEADNEYFQQQQEAARRKRYQKRSKLDSSREASLSNYDDAMRGDMVTNDPLKAGAKKQAGSKSNLAGPVLAHADSLPTTSKNSGGGMFKKFKKNSYHLLGNRKATKGQAPGDKTSVTSSEVSSLKGTLPLYSSTLDSLRSNSQFTSHPASPCDRHGSSNVPFQFHVTPPPPSIRPPLTQTDTTSRDEDHALNNDTADDVFNSNGQFAERGSGGAFGSIVRVHAAGPPLASLDSPFEDSIEVNVNENMSFRDEPPGNNPGPSQSKNNCCPPLKISANRRLSSTSESKFNRVVDRMVEIANENQDLVDQIVQKVGTLPDPAEYVNQWRAPTDGSNMPENDAATSQEALGAVGGIGPLFPGSNPPRRKPSLPLCSPFSPTNVIMNQIRNSSTYEEFRNIFDLILAPLHNVVDAANSYYSGSNSRQQPRLETSTAGAEPSTSSPGGRSDGNNTVRSVSGQLSTFLTVISVLVGANDDPLGVSLAPSLLRYIEENFGRQLQDAGGYESLFSDHHTTDENVDLD